MTFEIAALYCALIGLMFAFYGLHTDGKKIRDLQHEFHRLEYELSKVHDKVEPSRVTEREKHLRAILDAKRGER